MNSNISEKEKLISSIFILEKNRNIEFFDEHLTYLSNLIVSITKKLATEKTPLKTHEEYLEEHYFKFIIQLLSLKQLFKGTPLNALNTNHKFQDLSSIYILTRSIIELSLTIDYLYYNSKSDEQSRFRYLLYIVGGLNNRQSFPTLSNDNNNKKDIEKIEINKMINEIKNNLYFKSIYPKKQNHILGKLQAFEIGIKEMITESGLNNDTFHSTWRLFSNYSHSEFIEVMQTRDYIKNPNEQISILFNTYRICFMLACYQIIKLTKRFKEANIVFEEEPLETKLIIEFYYNLFIKV